jgi:hypothetical protein
MMLWFVIIGAAFAAGWAAVTPETYGLVDSRYDQKRKRAA